MSEAIAVDVQMDELDEEITWRARPPMLPILAAAGGALVIGIAVGVGAGLLLGELSAEAVPEPAEIVSVVEDLGVVNVNLRGADGERVLAIRAQVRVDTTDGSRVAALAPALRDGVLLLASDHTAEELLMSTGRARFRRELQQRLDLVLGADVVTELFLTELVVK